MSTKPEDRTVPVDQYGLGVANPYAASNAAYAALDRDWDNAPLVELKIADLLATETHLDPAPIARLASGKYKFRDDYHPHVIHDAKWDRHFIMDGHHRVAAWALLGNATIQVHVLPMEVDQ